MFVAPSPRHPYSLGIWQNQIERIMAAWIAELPVRIYYGSEVADFALTALTAWFGAA
jgi:hypothetical protein